MLKAVKQSGGELKIFPFCFFACQFVQGCPNLGKISNVGSEEITQSHELSDLMECFGRFTVMNCLEFVTSWQNSIWGEPVAQVAHIVCTKLALFQVHF